GQEPAARARLQPRRRLRDPGRHHHRGAEADRDHDHGHRFSARRPGRRGNPRLPSAGALQGQRREVRQRIHLPQGRQEEVTEPVMSLKVTNARRKQRVRNSLRRSANGRPRLSVFRSSKHIYAQVIDDLKGETLASASSLEKTMRDGGNTGANIDAAKAVGKLLAERAVQNGVKEVVSDRGSYLYHGRVKALADAARESGLSFYRTALDDSVDRRFTSLKI